VGGVEEMRTTEMLQKQLILKLPPHDDLRFGHEGVNFWYLRDLASAICGSHLLEWAGELIGI
jgi:hypothetical protein